ncbi:MAG: ABC transporter ATP-binding protein [Neomegalonema sp.]|nr:ABC transporter ATP-binding protein [Neomegalonema sp.]
MGTEEAQGDALLLQAQGLVAGYGGAPILNGVDLSLSIKDVGVIVGPNGAGKSTTLKALFGLVRLSGGSVKIGGRETTNMPPHQLARRGAAFVPQEHNVFPSMSVEENLELGGYIRRDSLTPLIEHVYQLFPALKEKRRQPAGELSGGQRQMVAIGRALMLEPTLLMLDEPTAGLSPKVMGEIFDRILAVNAEGVGVLMVEQNAKQALAIASKGFVLASGQNRFTGTGRELLEDPEVAKSFLGG